MTRKHRFRIALQETACNQIEHVVGAIADGQLIFADTEFLPQCLLEVPGIGIGVKPDIGSRVLDRGPRQGGTAQRVLVGREFVGVTDTEFAFEFLDGFTRLVRLKLVDLRQCAVDYSHLQGCPGIRA